MAKNDKPVVEATGTKEATISQRGGVRGVARLRRAMNLSINVPLEKLCDEAAAEIEGLRLKAVDRRP